MRPLTLAKTAGAAFVTATVGGLASRPAESTWYARLKKPRFQPPRQVFPIVWPILYADIAAVSASTVDHFHDQKQPEKARAYTALAGRQPRPERQLDVAVLHPPPTRRVCGGGRGADRQ